MEIQEETPNNDYLTQPGEKRAVSLIYGLVKSKPSTPIDFKPDDVKLVWFCKTLQNWKALVITTLPDQLFYEVTYNGDKREAYVDVYNKRVNICVKDEA